MPFIDLPSIRLHYLEEGVGPPLVWLPGGNDCAELMLHAHRRLTQHRRLICIDPRGQGRSDGPTTPEEYAPSAYVSDLLGALDALGLDQVALGGHSRGGRTSVEFALTYPSRVTGVIAAASPLLGFGGERGPRLRGYQQVLAEQGIDAFLEAVGTGPRHPERHAVWRAAAHHAGPKALIAQYEALTRLPPLTERLRGLTVPALIMSGDGDHLLSHAHTAAAATPNAELFIVPSARHALFADNPDDYFTALTGFLAGLP